MTDGQLLVAAAVLVPLVVVALAAMIRGYHVKFKMYRPRKEDTDGQR